MEKRLWLALLLSFLVYLAWLQFLPQRRPPPETVGPVPPVNTETGAPAPAAAASTEPPAAAPLEGASEEQELVLDVGKPGERGAYQARFSNRGAALLELRLGDSWDSPDLSADERTQVSHWTHLVDSVPLPNARAGARTHTGSLVLRATDKELEPTALETALWNMRELESGDGVEFDLATPGGLRYVKRVRFRPNAYELVLELEIANESRAKAAATQYQLTPAEVVPLVSGDRYYVEPQAVAFAWKGQTKLRTIKPEKDGDPPGNPFNLPGAPLSFAGVENKYFAMLLFAEDDRNRATMTDAYWRALPDSAFADEHPTQRAKSFRFLATDVLLRLDVPPVGESRTFEYVVYAGPKAPTTLKSANPHFQKLVDSDLGVFDAIARVLVSVLNFFERITSNWGVAVILLTVTVRLALFPLNRRSQTAMARYQKKMKRVQPMLEEIKKKYAGKPDKLRTEQAALMQREGAFPPLGGCLPMFIQLPIFFGLFAALRSSYDLRHAPFFGWIHDLSMPDRLLRIDLSLPIVGTIQYLNVLPPLMVVLWILQQRLMPKPTDEQAARMQRMMMWMPVFMGFFLYEYAAGLSLYMITQSTLGIVEMTWVKRLWPIDDRELPPKKDGFMARLAEKQKELERMHQQKATRARRPKRR